MVFICKITITTSTGQNFVFDSASEIKINKHWRKYTQTASIILPKNISVINLGYVEPLGDITKRFKKGDKVKIELGYNRILKTEFEGYIKEIILDIPFEIICEDEMWVLKNKTVNVNIEDATVRQILEAAAPNYKVYCADEKYGDFSLNNTTPVQIFEELKKKAGIYTFFRNKRLVAGIPYSDSLVSDIVPNYVLGKNIIDSDLKYNGDDVKVKVYVRCIKNNGEVRVADKGNEGGDIVRINYDYELSKKELQNIANNKHEYYVNLGTVTGSIKSFGFPFVEHGQLINYIDEVRSNFKAKLYIDEIDINVSATGGYRKELKISKEKK